MHSKSDCRLLWRVVADMFIVFMAAGTKGGEVEGRRRTRSPTSEFSKDPSLYGGQTDGNSGTRASPSTHPTTPQIPEHAHTHTSMPSHHISKKKLFFHQLLQSHEVAAFSATICPQSAHAACATLNEVIPNNSTASFLI